MRSLEQRFGAVNTVRRYIVRVVAQGLQKTTCTPIALIRETLAAHLLLPLILLVNNLYKQVSNVNLS